MSKVTPIGAPKSRFSATVALLLKRSGSNGSTSRATRAPRPSRSAHQPARLEQRLGQIRPSAWGTTPRSPEAVDVVAEPRQSRGPGPASAGAPPGRRCRRPHSRSSRHRDRRASCRTRWASPSSARTRTALLLRQLARAHGTMPQAIEQIVLDRPGEDRRGLADIGDARGRARRPAAERSRPRPGRHGPPAARAGRRARASAPPCPPPAGPMMATAWAGRARSSGHPGRSRPGRRPA